MPDIRVFGQRAGCENTEPALDYGAVRSPECSASVVFLLRLAEEFTSVHEAAIGLGK